VINSPEVYFDIKRQHAEVGHKNIINFSYKNHLGQIFHKYKTIHIKRFTTQLCAIFGTGVSHNIT
jgi:hypothetical protein